MKSSAPPKAGRRKAPDGSLRASSGQNPAVQAARLAEAISLARGERVLDLGCGRAASSLFLAREYGAAVWAVDLDVSPTENLAAIRRAGCESLVFPLRADARDLPFAEEYFDAAIAIDSYHYFGTDDRFLPYLAGFVRSGGHIGVADVAFTREIPTADDAPEFLRATFGEHWSFVHSVEWWRNEWERTGLVDIVAADPLPESRRLLQDYVLDRAAAGRSDEIARAAVDDDEGLLVLFRIVARKR
ncbi:MAG TPA: methyltransferase domain-containing protein [Thermoanaerobaculia bacterium]|nr:methyltransferase domain-containing protein [Thermoanaerobaculia bacterium]